MSTLTSEETEERLERLERFAHLQNSKAWEETAPYVFGVGDVVESKIPRHNGLRCLIESVHVVGDDNVFRCTTFDDGDIHLFRYKELKLIRSATSPEKP